MRDWGIVDPDAGKLQRLKASVHGKSKVFANVSGHTVSLGDRSLGDIIRGSVFLDSPTPYAWQARQQAYQLTRTT